jgi:hypothetical protein
MVAETPGVEWRFGIRYFVLKLWDKETWEISYG